jgi:ubiquinone biosynthesis protein COQ9
VDALWYAAGDASSDFSFYTKRATLAAIYSATLLYWLEDGSEDFADSWDFLGRRVADALKIPKLRKEARQRLERLPNPLSFLSAPGRARRRFGVRG